MEEINKTSHEASREKIGAAETSLAVTSLGGQEKTVNEGKLSTINPLRGIERKHSKKACMRRSNRRPKYENKAKLTDKAAMQVVLDRTVRYPNSEIPTKTPEKDAVAAIVDYAQNREFHLQKERNSPDIDAPLYDNNSIRDRVAAIKTVVAEDPSLVKTTEIEWKDQPDKEKTHVMHDLTLDQQAQLSELIRQVKTDGILVDGPIQCGKAKVDAFDIEIYEDKEKEFLSFHERPYGLKGDYRVLLKKCIQEMEDVGVGKLNEDSPEVPIRYASPGFFAKRPHCPKLRLCYTCPRLNKS